MALKNPEIEGWVRNPYPDSRLLLGVQMFAADKTSLFLFLRLAPLVAQLLGCGNYKITSDPVHV